MAYDPSRRPRHPVAVAELNDSATLAQAATFLDGTIDTMSTAAARQAAMHAITILRGASRSLTP
ncbi:hypothetical protein ACFRJ8_14820 [Arthrobacter sp. NPDC056886]|uniref:hypothetical protein n=1 Tax=Arthrobacter sp. NPDC056886 TaxID=3345960 RepID=UPI00366EAB40